MPSILRAHDAEFLAPYPDCLDQTPDEENQDEGHPLGIHRARRSRKAPPCQSRKHQGDQAANDHPAPCHSLLPKIGTEGHHPDSPARPFQVQENPPSWFSFLPAQEADIRKPCVVADQQLALARPATLDPRPPTLDQALGP